MKFNELVKLLAFLLASLVLLIYMPAAFVGGVSWPLLGGATISLWAMIAFFMIFAYYPPTFKTPKKQTKRVAEAKPQIAAKTLEVDPLTLPSNKVTLVGVDNNPHIVDGAQKLTIDIINEDEDYPLFNIEDFRFVLEYVPSALVYGASGGGKSVLVYNILQNLAKSPYNPRFVIADFGGLDWTDSEFKTPDQIVELFEWLQIINRGRQLDAKMGPRIVVLLEEMQAFLTTLKMLDAKDKTKKFDTFTLTASQIIMTSRKTGACHLVGVLQNPKAEIIDTNLRENMGALFGLRSSKNLAGRIMRAPTEIADRMPVLQPGYAYSHLLDAFIQYPKLDRPQLDRISRRELFLLKQSYIRKYGEKVTMEETDG